MIWLTDWLIFIEQWTCNKRTRDSLSKNQSRKLKIKHWNNKKFLQCALTYQITKQVVANFLVNVYFTKWKLTAFLDFSFKYFDYVVRKVFCINIAKFIKILYL